MPPVFEEKDFEFKEGQKVLKHTDANPLGRDRDPDKYAVAVELIGANLIFLAAIDINSLRTARLLASARKLEDGIGNQFRTHIIEPSVE